GGGWSVTGPGPVPSALAIKVEVPWTEANRPHDLVITLLDADGRPVSADGAPVEIRGQFEVGRPPGLPAGTPLDTVLALNVGPLRLAPGRYLWRLAIDGESRDDWSVGFLNRGEAP